MAAGTILTSVLVDGGPVGSEWAVGWNFDVDQSGNITAVGVVDSVDGLGAVVTYTITDGGSGYSVGLATLVGTDPDVTSEATINILSVETAGSGYLNIWH